MSAHEGSGAHADDSVNPDDGLDIDTGVRNWDRDDLITLIRECCGKIATRRANRYLDLVESLGVTSDYGTRKNRPKFLASIPYEGDETLLVADLWHTGGLFFMRSSFCHHRVFASEAAQQTLLDTWNTLQCEPLDLERNSQKAGQLDSMTDAGFDRLLAVITWTINSMKAGTLLDTP
jgi:hypothetical protein